MNADELLRAIEQLHMQQHRVVVRLMASPDDESTRQRYRDMAAQLRMLRLRVEKERPGQGRRV